VIYIYTIRYFTTNLGEERQPAYGLFADIGFAEVSSAEKFYQLISGQEQSWRKWQGFEYHTVIFVEQLHPLADRFPLEIGMQKDETIPF
jgi:hypothetical protein